MDIRILKAYKDLILGRIVNLDEILTVTKERGEYMISIGYAEAMRKGRVSSTSYSFSSADNNSEEESGCQN
jgi:hypothetical protein